MLESFTEQKGGFTDTNGSNFFFLEKAYVNFILN